MKANERQGTAKKSFHIGADENGLGPRLGPMIITAVLAKATEHGFESAQKALSGAMSQRLGDSKKLLAHGDITLGEAWARALAERGAGRPEFGKSPANPDDLVHAISLDDSAYLKAPCPSQASPQCWSKEGEAFHAPQALVDAVSKDIDELSRAGFDLLSVRSVILCAFRMNDGLREGKNRFVLDLHSMERLILSLRAEAGSNIQAVCGKVGGFGKYSDAFSLLSGQLHSVLSETRAKSAYHFPRIGEISFVRDGDASDPCVALASIVGKYLREILMARIARHYRAHNPELPDASGYHDPITKVFVEKTIELRRTKSIPDDCFERRGSEGGKKA